MCTPGTVHGLDCTVQYNEQIRQLYGREGGDGGCRVQSRNPMRGQTGKGAGGEIYSRIWSSLFMDMVRFIQEYGPVYLNATLTCLLTTTWSS